MILCIEEIWNLNSIGYNLWLYAVGRICICVWYSQDYVLQLLRCFSMGWFEVWLVQYFYQNHPCCSRLCDPRGDQIGSPKLHGRHQRPEESAVFCWKHGWQWWKLMASGRVLENSHPTKILQHFGGIRCSPETKSSTKQHVLGVLSLGFLSNNCHELVKFWGQHLPTNLKLDIFLRCATAQDRAGRNARLLKARAATAAASNLWQWSKLPNCNQNRWWICEFLWVVNDSSTADDQNWRHQF